VATAGVAGTWANGEADAGSAAQVAASSEEQAIAARAAAEPARAAVSSEEQAMAARAAADGGDPAVRAAADWEDWAARAAADGGDPAVRAAADWEDWAARAAADWEDWAAREAADPAAREAEGWAPPETAPVLEVITHSIHSAQCRNSLSIALEPEVVPPVLGLGVAA